VGITVLARVAVMLLVARLVPLQEAGGSGATSSPDATGTPGALASDTATNLSATARNRAFPGRRAGRPPSRRRRAKQYRPSKRRNAR
jgi:hypothetical protein